MRFLLVLFIAVPIIEMMVLIKVGQLLGALSTIALVLLTAAVGYALIKQQGFATLQRAQQKIRGGEVPAPEIAEGLFLAVGGALLLTPGFVTDALGFCCLIPALRAGLVARGLKHFVAPASPPPPARGDNGETIEGEFRREK